MTIIAKLMAIPVCETW